MLPDESRKNESAFDFFGGEDHTCFHLLCLMHAPMEGMKGQILWASDGARKQFRDLVKATSVAVENFFLIGAIRRVRSDKIDDCANALASLPYAIAEPRGEPLFKHRSHATTVAAEVAAHILECKLDCPANREELREVIAKRVGLRDVIRKALTDYPHQVDWLQYQFEQLKKKYGFQ